MSTFTIKSANKVSEALYENGDYNVKVSYTEDLTEATVKNINGTIYKSTVFSGVFNGNLNEGKMSYTFNGVALGDMADVVTMVTDIENNIKG